MTVIKPTTSDPKETENSLKQFKSRRAQKSFWKGIITGLKIARDHPNEIGEILETYRQHLENWKSTSLIKR